MKMKTITVRVTKKRIENGIRDSCDSCPIALSIQCKPGMEHCSVDRSHLCLENGDSIKLPPEARQFIRQFDKGKPVAPIAFKLKLPEAK